MISSTDMTSTRPHLAGSIIIFNIVEKICFYQALGKNTGRHTIEYSDCVASVYSWSEIGRYIYVFTECLVKCFVCRLYVLFLHLNFCIILATFKSNQTVSSLLSGTVYAISMRNYIDFSMFSRKIPWLPMKPALANAIFALKVLQVRFWFRHGLVSVHEAFAMWAWSPSLQYQQKHIPSKVNALSCLTFSRFW